MDHFSKYKWTELIENKEAKTIAERLEYIFNYFKAPKILQTDNGREFNNQEVMNLCERKNIKFINGSPYHPQSQGVVEKLNDLLAKSLHSSLQAFKRNKENKKWNIELALKAWTSSSNQNVHSVTRKIPYRAIHMENEKEIQEVIGNTNNYYSKRRKAKAKDLDLQIGMKMFIVNQMQILKSKKKLICVKKNNLKTRTMRNKVRIPVEITDISNLESLFVKVKIRGKSNQEMKLNEIYAVGINNLEIAKCERSWNLLINNSNNA